MGKWPSVCGWVGGGEIMPPWGDGREGESFGDGSPFQCVCGVCVLLLRTGMLNRFRACCTQLGLTRLHLLRPCRRRGYMCMYISLYLYIYVCMCVCV